MKAIITSLFWFVSSIAYAQEALERHMGMFPNASVPPPILATGSDGGVFIPGWTGQDREYSFYLPSDGVDAGYVQIVELDDGYTIDSFFDLLITKAELDDVDRPEGVEAEAFKVTYGPMVAAVFGKATHHGKPVHFFADLYGPDDDSKITGSLMYGTPEIFNSWDGALLPLVHNGYIEDPSQYESRDVFRDGTDAQKTSFYVGMVNSRIMSDFNTLLTLNEGALQAARNATTISGCAIASNCSVSYDGAGNAVADFDQ